MNYEADIPAPTGSQTMEVHYYNWRNQITITHPGTNQAIYTLTSDRWCRDFTITNAAGRTLGTTKIHSMTNKIEVQTMTLNGVTNSFNIKNDKVIVGSPAFTSPAFGNQEMTWKNKAMARRIDYTLIEGKGLALAKFESDPKTRVGRLDIVDSVMEEDCLDEIAVTLLTLLQRKLRAIEVSTIAAIT